MRRFSFVLIFLIAGLSMGCSQRYGLERQLWLLERKATEAVADPNQIVDSQINDLLKETDILVPSARSRGLGARVLLLKAILLAAQSKNAEAIEQEKELKKKEEKFVFLNGLSKWYLKRKDYKDALVCFDKSMSLVKGSPIYYRGLVDMYLIAKQAGKGDVYASLAEAEYRKAMKSDKTVVRYLGEKGLSNLKIVLGDLQDALQLLNDIVEDKKYPKQLRARAIIDRLTIFLREQDFKHARAETERAKELKMPQDLIERMNKLIKAVEKKVKKS